MKDTGSSAKDQKEILVVDDKEESLQLLTSILTENGYRVRPALTGAIALRSAASKIPDLVLLDVRMPEMDGYEVCRHFKSDEQYKDIPIIFISGAGEAISKVEGFESGGIDYITKPFEPEEVLARVRTHLHLKELTEELEQKVHERTEELQREIFEHKQAQKSLKESERKLHAIFNQTYQFIGLMDLEGTLLEANRTALKFSGIEESDVIGKSFWETPWWTHSPDLQKKLKEAVEKAAGGEFVRFEATHPDADGTIHYVDFSIKPVKDESGKVILLIPEGRDITERKKADEERRKVEDALRESEEKYRRIFNSFVDVYFETDVEGNVLEVSPSIEKYTGYKREDIIGKSAVGFYTDPERRKEYIQELSEKGYAHGFYIDFFKKDGQVVSLSSTARAEKDPEGNITKIIGVLHDITEQKNAEEERKKAEDALRESEKKYRAIFNSYIDVYVETNMEGKIIEVSPSIEAFGGYKREEFIGKSAADLYADPGVREELIREISEKGYVKSFDTDLICKGGHTVPVSISSRLEKDSNGNPQKLVGIIHDISDRKKAEEEKNELREQLLQSQKLESVGRLAGGVAHDFNNMLNVIIGHSDMALFNMPDEDPLKKRLEEISKAAHRSADLTRQLLAFARHQTVEPKVLNLNNTINSTLSMLGRLIGEDIELVWRPSETSVLINIDPAQLSQLLANLTVNARDAIEGVGTIAIETGLVEFDQVYCSVHTGYIPGRYAMFSVSDDGEGMDEKTKNNIFEPFFTTKGVGEGTGLGLSTVYGIIKQNDGFVNVYSEPGQGSIFRIYLPAYEEDVMEEVEKKEHVAALARGNETVLFVEDEKSILEIGKEMLENLGYNVLAALTPAEAVSIVEKYEDTIHLLITDVVMPEMNGRELAEKISSIYPKMKSLYISGYTSNIIEHRGVLDEGVKFLQKPFSKKELSDKVREVLESY